MSRRAGHSHLPTPTSSPTLQRSIPAPNRDTHLSHLEDLHRKYIFYTFRTHICGELVRKKVAHEQIPNLHARATAEITNDPSRYPGLERPPTSAAEVAEFWRKCDAVCRAEGPGEDPLGWVRQWMIGGIVQQFIMEKELPKTSVGNTNIYAQWRAEVNTMMAANVGSTLSTGPTPGVLGRARLLDWVGHSFQTRNGKRHHVTDGGTTVSQGPFFTLEDDAGNASTISALEFEAMVKGLPIPMPSTDF
ncbi:hypothetical protein OF83DRAFT_1133555 [Amylostereum chailletii]|nr:hypothetical protein OF83DRAFT_1133555 [Amylostereum chailletii]